jgi:hypothetical protein
MRQCLNGAIGGTVAGGAIGMLYAFQVAKRLGEAMAILFGIEFEETNGHGIGF